MILVSAALVQFQSSSRAVPAGRMICILSICLSGFTMDWLLDYKSIRFHFRLVINCPQR